MGEFFSLPKLAADEVFGLVNTELGNSAFIVQILYLKIEIHTILKKTAKVNYKKAFKRIYTNSLIVVRYNPQFKKGVILYKLSDSERSIALTHYNVRLYEQQ